MDAYPADSGAFHDRVSAHLRDLVLAQICVVSSPTVTTGIGISDWTDGLEADLQRAADVISSAWSYPGRYLIETADGSQSLTISPIVPVPWNAQDLADQLSKRPSGLCMALEDALLDTFPPMCGIEAVLQNNFPLLRRPAVLVDPQNRILLWYLPGVLSSERQVKRADLQ